MIDRRLLFIAFLVLLPVLVCVGFGAHAIWVTGYWKTLWWVVPACWVIAWAAAKCWPRRGMALDFSPIDAPRHWTTRDHEAVEIISARQKAFTTVDREKLSDPQHYLQEIQSLALEISGHYHLTSGVEPGETDSNATAALDSLTIVEVTAAARLAIDDLEEFLIQSVPGSRMLTIGHWGLLSQAPQWYSVVSNVYWAGSILLNPANLLRYGSSKAVAAPVMSQLQSELIATIYLRFIRQVGFYLIEMNSGRLRAGSDVYRSTFGSGANDSLEAAAAGGDEVSVSDSEGQTRSHGASISDIPEGLTATGLPITIGLIGQTGAGKSSLINAMLGPSSQEATAPSVAEVDVLPRTRSVETYQWEGAGDAEKVELLDTPGYGEAGASAKQMKQMESALTRSDVLLLVTDGHSPAKQADQATLMMLKEHYRANASLRRPSVVVVVTHIDLIPPAMVWQPPYDLDAPTDAKGENVVGAIDYAREVFGEDVQEVVGVCLSPDPQRRWGLEEMLLPSVIRQLDDGQAVSLVRAFEQHADQGRLKALLAQVGQLARHSIQAWGEERLARITGSEEEPEEPRKPPSDRSN